MVIKKELAVGKQPKKSVMWEVVPDLGVEAKTPRDGVEGGAAGANCLRKVQEEASTVSLATEKES